MALISRARSVTRNFDAALFGNLLGVSTTDLYVIAGVLAATVLTIFFLYKQLLFMTFDPEVAPIYGVRTGLVDAVFALILAATVIASIRIMGVTLIAASLVIPPVIARLLSDRFAVMLVLSAVIGRLLGIRRALHQLLRRHRLRGEHRALLGRALCHRDALRERARMDSHRPAGTRDARPLLRGFADGRALRLRRAYGRTSWPAAFRCMETLAPGILWGMHHALNEAFKTAIAGRDEDVDLFSGAMAIAALGRPQDRTGTVPRDAR